MHLTLGQQGRALRSKDSLEKTSEEASSGSSDPQSEKANLEQHASRELRERGFSEWKLGSWAGDRPPAVFWVKQDGPGRWLELQPDVSQRTLVRSAVRHVKPGSEVDADDSSGYRLLSSAYDHRSVDHEETYVTKDGVHYNSAEVEW